MLEMQEILNGFEKKITHAYYSNGWKQKNYQARIGNRTKCLTWKDAVSREWMRMSSILWVSFGVLTTFLLLLFLSKLNLCADKPIYAVSSARATSPSNACVSINCQHWA